MWVILLSCVSVSFWDVLERKDGNTCILLFGKLTIAERLFLEFLAVCPCKKPGHMFSIVLLIYLEFFSLFVSSGFHLSDTFISSIGCCVVAGSC